MIIVVSITLMFYITIAVLYIKIKLNRKEKSHKKYMEELESKLLKLNKENEDSLDNILNMMSNNNSSISINDIKNQKRYNNNGEFDIIETIIINKVRKDATRNGYSNYRTD